MAMNLKNERRWHRRQARHASVLRRYQEKWDRWVALGEQRWRFLMGDPEEQAA